MNKISPPQALPTGNFPSPLAGNGRKEWDGSQAVEELNHYYRSNEPFGRARDETVSVANLTALPVDQTVLTSASNHMKTYRVQWQETVTSRDGRVLSRSPMWALVTVEWRPPRNEIEVHRSGDGVWITSFSVSQQ